eukprot:4787427-Prymnesium_polylepis.2
MEIAPWLWCGSPDGDNSPTERFELLSVKPRVAPATALSSNTALPLMTSPADCSLSDESVSKVARKRLRSTKEALWVVPACRKEKSNSAPCKMVGVPSLQRAVLGVSDAPDGQTAGFTPRPRHAKPALDDAACEPVTGDT